MPHIYKSGERVLLKVRVGRKEKELIAVFQAMQTKSRVIVTIVNPAKLDDDGVRLVDLKSIKPYYNEPSDQQRRARHVARQYKIGVRIFRVDKPEGRVFCVDTIDVEQNIAVGRVAKCKTVKIVPLHTLWPNLR